MIVGLNLFTGHPQHAAHLYFHFANDRKWPIVLVHGRVAESKTTPGPLRTLRRKSFVQAQPCGLETPASGWSAQAAL